MADGGSDGAGGTAAAVPAGTAAPAAAGGAGTGTGAAAAPRFATMRMLSRGWWLFLLRGVVSILFGILALFSIFGMVMAERRARRKADATLDKARAMTSILPFVAIAQRRARFALDMPMLLALTVSAVLTAWMLLGGHAALFGADPLAMTAI